MADQRNEAAERSAHVHRGAAGGEVLGPCVEVSPGVWRLRALVEAEARVAELAGALFRMEDLRQAYREGAEAMREAAAQYLQRAVKNLRNEVDHTDHCHSVLMAVCDGFFRISTEISALPLPEGGA
jgi:hypothetical protein